MLHPVVTYFDTRGFATKKYLEMAGIDSAMLETETSLIPTNLVFHFVRLACEAENSEDVGLLLGQSTSLEMLGEFGRRLLSTDTVEDYLELGCRTINTSASGDYYWLAKEAAGTRFCASVIGLQEPDAIQNYLYVILVTLNTIRNAVGGPWCPAEVTVPRIPSATATRFAEIIPATTILGGGNFASILIPDDALRQPMPTPAENLAEQIFAKPMPPIPTDFRAAIVHLLENLIIMGRPDIDTAAGIIGLSTRTVQRRLAECGTCFSGLVAETRVAMASRWIQEGGRSIADIARGLGYHDAANFSRAFHRITGISPRAYRDDISR